MYPLTLLPAWPSRSGCDVAPKGSGGGSSSAVFCAAGSGAVAGPEAGTAGVLGDCSGAAAPTSSTGCPAASAQPLSVHSVRAAVCLSMHRKAGISEKNARQYAAAVPGHQGLLPCSMMKHVNSPACEIYQPSAAWAVTVKGHGPSRPACCTRLLVAQHEDARGLVMAPQRLPARVGIEGDVLLLRRHHTHGVLQRVAARLLPLAGARLAGLPCCA